ncbi:MAG: methionine--tRNA ligase subunit beta [Candidatus Wallbacteria bacterium]|nr:methionine--tRNA ligase subunit beta [Candidatus Wallbacteria bacterium]
MSGRLAGKTLSLGAPLFPRLEAPVKVEATPKPAAKPLAPKPAARPQAAPAESLGYDDFMRADLRVARIVTAARVPNADKLLQLSVSLGEAGERQVVAGIAQSYAPEELVGKQVVLVANLAPAKIRGIESHGMILAATDADGKHHVVTPDGSTPDGGRVK